MKRMNYNHLYYFHAVATAGSVNRAARSLGVSPSTVSEQISGVERYLDAQLFERTNSRLHLTRDGAKALEFTKRIFRETERLDSVFSSSPSTDQCLEIGVDLALSSFCDRRRFGELLQHDASCVRIKIGARDELIDSLMYNRIDMVLAVEHEFPKHTVSTVIDEFGYALYAPRSWCRDDESGPSIIDGKKFIHHLIDSAMFCSVETFFAEHGIEPKVAMRTNDTSLMRLAVEEGWAAAVLPDTVTRTPYFREASHCLGPLSVAKQRICAVSMSSRLEGGSHVASAIAALTAQGTARS